MFENQATAMPPTTPTALAPSGGAHDIETAAMPPTTPAVPPASPEETAEFKKLTAMLATTPRKMKRVWNM